MTIFWPGRVNEQFTIVTIVMKMKTNMTMMTMTRGSGQNQGWSTFPSIDGPPARLGTHHTLMTRMTMAKWRWQNDSDNKKWPWFNQILFTIMETFIHDSGNSDVHSKDGNVLLSNNSLHTIFCNYCILYFLFIGPESDHWECLSLTDWLPNSLLFSKLDWCDSGMWRWQLKTCWSCYCCWYWWWETCWQQFGADLEGEVWS